MRAAYRGMLEDRLAGLPTRRLGGLDVRVALTPHARLLGLALLDEVPAGSALLIPRCRSIHTFGMRFPLDVVFLDERDRLVRLVEGVPSRRVLWCASARAVIETTAGSGRPFADVLSPARPGGSPAAG